MVGKQFDALLELESGQGVALRGADFVENHGTNWVKFGMTNYINNINYLVLIVGLKLRIQGAVKNGLECGETRYGVISG